MQPRVAEVRKLLAARSVPVWMDIDNGMELDIYDSMAIGVQKAACVIPFMTEKYEVSENVRS